MIRKKVLFVFGTRPEAIKMAPLIHKFRNNKYLDVKILVTAQHREMLDQVLSFFDLVPDYDLNLMKPNQDLTDVTIYILDGCRSIYKNIEPDLVVVHGDTTTTFAATLAAYYQKIDVAHIEAGLRTGNIYSPFPEEINRQLTARMAKFHFAPTELSKSNLVREGILESNIFVTGNTVVDALFASLEKKRQAEEVISFGSYEFNCGRPLVLITGHRRENFGDGIKNICAAIKELSEEWINFDFVFPVHLNPNISKPVNDVLGDISNVFLIKPLDYFNFITLMDKSYLILTDSGGVQEEAPSLGKPVLVMRDNTERPEGLEAGSIKLVGTTKEMIVSEVSRLISSSEDYNKMANATNPYGDGKASEKILNLLLENWDLKMND